MTVELIQGLLLAFALIVILMSPYIRLLQALGFGKQIRADGPESHFAKAGTPTMGGLLIVAVVVGIYFFLRRAPDASTFAPIAALAGVGLLGAFDDYLNARTGTGIRARQKLIWLTVVAFVAAWQIQRTYDITAIAVPFVGAVAIDPAVYVIFAAFAIIAAANGVNLTDGLDGLSGGTLAIAFVAFLLIALLNIPAQPNLALLCALIIGALLGFLWFNVHPAQIFIGDSGALSLGATLAVTALITGQILVLPLIGIIFVIETGSVILQVGYFRLSGGKRLFRMSPIHHHFELGGWNEEKITIRFWILGRAGCPAGRDALPGVAGSAAVTTMTTTARIDLDRLTLDAIGQGALRGRPVTVLGLARSGIALARFLADAGALVTVYDGRPADMLGEAIAGLGGRSVTLALGPEVDPAATWADAGLVATSPSISPDYPTTEPRLRAALRDLVAAADRADSPGPALVSEADLFLRLCPAPTIGVTGTKGKTTTSSLIAALLAVDTAHPVVLGGNIGSPLIDRLPELTTAHRVVDELSELQLPTLSRGTTAAVYTNVTSDHLDRHGSLDAYRSVKRRLAELVDPAGVLVLNDDDPVVTGYARDPATPVIRYRRDRPLAGGLGVVEGWIVADEVARLALAGGGLAPMGLDGRVMPITELGIPGAHNVSNALAAIAVALAFGIDPAVIRRSAGSFSGVEHRLETVAIVDGRPLRQRFAGDPARRGDRRAAGLRSADRAHRGWPRQGDRSQQSRAGGGRASGGRGPDRGERAGAGGIVPDGRARADRARRRPGNRCPTRGFRSPASSRGRPCCSVPPPPASTCSSITRRADGPSGRPWPPLPQNAPGAPLDEPVATDPASRTPPPRERTDAPGLSRSRQPDAGSKPRRGGPPRAPPGRLRDPRRDHGPDRGRDPDGLFVVGAQGLPVAERRHLRDRRAADPVGDRRDRRDGR